MSTSLPDSGSFEQLRPHFRWSKMDLLVVVSFFAVTWLGSALAIGVLFQNVSAITLVLLQGLLDALWVGFIFFLIRVVHGLPFLETIKWNRDYQIRTGALIATGISLAIVIAIVGSWFPPTTPTPLEKLLTAPGALYLFLLFGVGVAPVVE